MTYKVAECFKTVQGEGMNTGRAAVFVRFRGCNLWRGTAADRGRLACAAYCDVPALEDEEPGVAGRTSFARTNGPYGGAYDGVGLRAVIDELWRAPGRPFVVLTGGEPSLQVDHELVTALMGCDVAIETNGTRKLDVPIAWHITVSPKGAYEVVQRVGTELKLLFPQPESAAHPAVWELARERDEVYFDRYYLQPIEPLAGEFHDSNWAQNMDMTVEYVEAHPLWRVSVQTHKVLRVA